MAIGQTDLERLQEGLIGGQFWSAFIPEYVQMCIGVVIAPTNVPILIPANSAVNGSEASNLQILYDTLQQIDVIHQVILRAPTVLGFADSVTSFWDVFRSGRIASLIGVEGLHQICGSASVLRQFHRLGVRYITLCHSRNNQYVDSAVS